MMKRWMAMLGMLMCLLLVPMSAHAQAPQGKKSNDEAMTRLRVDIVLTEYNGEKKITSLPYTIDTLAWPTRFGPGRSSLRMGVRVPVPDSSSGSGFNYMDVGTDIDCRATNLDGGSYGLNIGVTRTSIYSAPQGGGENGNIHGLPDRPVVRNFNTQFDLVLRDGETSGGTSATDPFNGHVLKITVTLHVEK